MADNSKNFAKDQLSRFNPGFLQLATVMDNRDPTHTGKLKIWINGSQSDKDSRDSWIEASYLSPFAGRTPGIPGAESYQQYPKGYGFWAVPPDVGCTVAVMFVQGHIFEAYWFACLYDEKMNTMVPGMATQPMAELGYDSPVPVTDYDRNTITSSDKDKYPNVPMIEGLKKQNLLYDEEKGVANRSSTRQTTSTVYGMTSPRGNSFILDDGYTDAELNAPTWDQDPDGYQDTQFNNPVNDTSVGNRKNEGIVLRTRSGAQLLLSEASGDVFIINRDGTARIEMTGDGDINIHCDKNINMRAGQDINMTAGKSFNIEAGSDMNWSINGNTKLNLTGALDTKVGGQVVINAGADLRLVTAASLRTQSGGSTNITSAGATAITSNSTVEVSATAVNMTASGTNLNIQSGLINTNASVSATDFVSPSVSLNSHIHFHAAFTDASNHSNDMAAPVGGGSSPSTTSATPAEPANDVSPEMPVQNTQQAVQYINTTASVSEVLTEDLSTDESLTYPQNYEGLHMLMPCTGTIREFGYWGRGVPTAEGTTADRYGWSIQCKGNVIAPDGGLFTKIGNDYKDGFIITHKSGYKTIFYNLDSTVMNKDTVSKGQVIGTSNGVFTMEIRTRSSNIFGFSGTVDPGLFYTTVTGQGVNAANKTLTEGKPSNENAPEISAIQTSVDSDELVVMTNVQSIGSGYSQRGSRRVPKRTNAKSRKTSVSSGSSAPEDLSSVDKTPSDWKVTNSDAKLLSDLKEYEGNISYQTKVGYYYNDRFWPYRDSRGFMTIGYGHLILRNENFVNGITESEADAMLQKDVVTALNGAKSIYSQYNMKVPYIAQLTLVEMVFQMGKGAVLKFKGTLSALAENDYKKAAMGMRNSAWYKQTPSRAEAMARRIEACG